MAKSNLRSTDDNEIMSHKHSCDEEEILSWKDVGQDGNKSEVDDDDGDDDDEMNDVAVVDTQNFQVSAARIDATGMITKSSTRGVSTKTARRRLHEFWQSSRELSRHKDWTGNTSIATPARSPNKHADTNDYCNESCGCSCNNDNSSSSSSSSSNKGLQNQLKKVQQELLVELLQSREGQWLIQNAMAQTATRPQTSIPHGSYPQENTGRYPPTNEIDIAPAEEGNNNMYPQDAYSILALNGPTWNEGWPRQKILFFLFGLMTFLFQLSLLGLLIYHLDLIQYGTTNIENAEEENPIDRASAPANAARVLCTSQVVSLLAYIVFPSSAQHDLIKSILLFPCRCTATTTKAAETVPLGCIRFSCILRGAQGYGALFAAILLIMQTNNNVDIILNFTAVNFISDLDDAAFSLAKSGIFGPALQQEARRIATTKLPKCMHRGSHHIWYSSVMVCSTAILFSVMMYLIILFKAPTNSLTAIATCVAKGIGLVFLLLSMACSTRGVCHLFHCGLSSAADTEADTEADMEAAIPEKKCIRSSVQTERTTATRQSLEWIQEILPDV